MNQDIRDYNSDLENGEQAIGALLANTIDRYLSLEDIDLPDIERWLEKSRLIAWDYKYITKRKGVLKRLK